MALVGPATDMTRIDPVERGTGDTWEELLVSDVYWDVMSSEAVFYPFFCWIMKDSQGNTELMFSYNGVDFSDEVKTVDSSTTSDQISPRLIEVLREYQG